MAPSPHPKLVSGTRQACTPKARLQEIPLVWHHHHHHGFPWPNLSSTWWPSHTGSDGARKEPLPQRGPRGTQPGWEGSALRGRREGQNGGECPGRENVFVSSRSVCPSFMGRFCHEGQRIRGWRPKKPLFTGISRT